MKARVFQVVIFLALMLAIIAMIKSGYAKEASLLQTSNAPTQVLPPGIGERCNHSATYREEIPASPGWENAYGIELPAEPDRDVVACTAFIWDANGLMYHYGFDVGMECQAGLCVAGMDIWKHHYEGKFWFWWEDPPAEVPPLEVEVWFREVNESENTPGPPTTYTPTPTAIPSGEGTPAPGPGEDPSPTQDASEQRLSWLPLVQK